ncbi:MAG: hypothetical protein EOO89_01780 [Pedobacter sp.]|nr:MAG: hypothetical protein EOO89_01780 [Pedobacter sp.]
MPTIEIASLNSSKLNLDPAAYKVTIIQEGTLVSHRGLFYDFLTKQSGVIVHIGNPDLQYANNEVFSAGQIIDWAFEDVEMVIPQPESMHSSDLVSIQQSSFQFLKEYKEDIDRILKIALKKSPLNQIYLLTDYQFGPENANQEVIYSIGNFWHLHDSHGLVFNTLYEMFED